jgi:hypothetical protein
MMSLDEHDDFDAQSFLFESSPISKDETSKVFLLLFSIPA